MQVIRNENGVMIAKVGNVLAGRIIEGSGGRWTEKNFTKGGKRTVYLITENMKWGSGVMEIFLWEGYYIDSQEG